MWDKMMRQCMFKAGFLALECSPGFFYHPSLGVECTVYVDDFVLIAPPAVEAKVWKILDAVITFKEPPVEVTRYFGVHHLFKKLQDGTVTMQTEAKSYLTAACKRFMEEIGVKDLAWVPCPNVDDRFDEASAVPGKLAKSAASHLMSVLYVARLVRADLAVTTSFLARRVSKWTLNEDRRLKRMMQHIWHHLDLCLNDALKADDFKDAELHYFPDAELGGDPLTTKATGGFWLELCSKEGSRRWPICWQSKKAGHTICATADSETWSLIGACELGLKKDVIPILQQIEVSLGRLVKLQGQEGNTACVAAAQRGYSPALRHLQRHIQLSTGFTYEVFYPDLTDPTAPQYLAKLDYGATEKQKGDWMTKELPPIKFAAALELAGLSQLG